MSGVIAVVNTLKQVKQNQVYPIFYSNDVAGSLIHCDDFWQDVYQVYSARNITGSSAYEMYDEKKYHLIDTGVWVEDERNFVSINSRNTVSVRLFEQDYAKISNNCVLNHAVLKTTRFYKILKIISQNFRIFRINQYYDFLAYYTNHYTKTHSKHHPVSYHYTDLKLSKLNESINELHIIKQNFEIVYDEFKGIEISDEEKHDFEEYFAKDSSFKDHLKECNHYRGFNIDSTDTEEHKFSKCVAFSWHVHGEKGYKPLEWDVNLQVADKEKVFSKISLKDHNHDDKYAVIGHTHLGDYAQKNHDHSWDFSLKDHKHDDIYILTSDTNVERPFSGSLNIYYQEFGAIPEFSDSKCFDMRVESIENLDLSFNNCSKLYNNGEYSIRMLTILDTESANFPKNLDDIVLEINGKIYPSAKVPLNYFYFDNEEEYINGIDNLDRSEYAESIVKRNKKYLFLELDFSTSRLDKDFYGTIKKINLAMQDGDDYYLIKDSFTNLYYLRYYDKIFAETFVGTEKNKISNKFVTSEIYVNNDSGFTDVDDERLSNTGGQANYKFTFNALRDNTYRFSSDVIGSLQWYIDGKRMLSDNLTPYRGNNLIFDFNDAKNWENGSSKKTDYTIEDYEGIPRKNISFSNINNGFLMKAYDSIDECIYDNKSFGLKFSIKPSDKTPKETDQIVFKKDYYTSVEGYFEVGFNLGGHENPRSYIYVDYMPKVLLAIRNSDDKYLNHTRSIFFEYCRLKFNLENLDINQWNDIIVRKPENGLIEVIKDSEVIRNIEVERFYFNEKGERISIFIPYERYIEYKDLMEKITSSNYQFGYKIGGSNERPDNSLKACQVADITLYGDFLYIKDDEFNVSFDFTTEKDKKYEMEIVYKSPESGTKLFIPKVASVYRGVPPNYESYESLDSSKFKLTTSDLIGKFLSGKAGNVITSKFDIEYYRHKKENSNSYLNRTIVLDDVNVEDLEDEYIFDYNFSKFYDFEEITESPSIKSSEKTASLYELQFELSLQEDTTMFFNHPVYFKMDDDDVVVEVSSIEVQRISKDRSIRIISKEPISISFSSEVSYYYKDSTVESYGNAEKFIESNDYENEEWVIPLGIKKNPTVIEIIGKDSYENFEDFRVFPFVFVIDNFGRQIPFLKTSEYLESEKSKLEGLFCLGKVNDNNLTISFYKKSNSEVKKIHMSGRAFIMF